MKINTEKYDIFLCMHMKISEHLHFPSLGFYLLSFRFYFFIFQLVNSLSECINITEYLTEFVVIVRHNMILSIVVIHCACIEYGHF